MISKEKNSIEMGWKKSTHINILLSFQEHNFSLIETEMKLKNINGQS